jgi:GNAT superfamily N-acetyltransferase
MRVVEVTAGSPVFESVLRLWRAHSDTLGFMPRGGFDDTARAGGLLAAENPDGGLAGYVMFRRTAQRNGSITHLCVNPAHRRQGVASSLFEAVKAAFADCYEIRLRCRRDFEASALWRRLGFVAVAEVAGRGREGTLTLWRYEMAALPLLRMLSETAQASSAVRAVIDANVFFDLDEQGDGHEESQGLVAAWFSEFVELAVTEEILNEINRRDDKGDRGRQRSRANRFPGVARNSARESALLPQIADILPRDGRASGRSDVRQIAMTIAGNVTFFVTRDGDVLGAAEALDDAFGLHVLSPHEMIRRFDELRREDLYRPRRLFYGPGIASSLARADDIDRMADLMHVGHDAGEPKRRTLGRLRELLASPDRYQATCIEKDEQLIAAYVVDRASAVRLAVPFFAVASTTLGRTAARHYGEAIVGLAAAEGRRLVHVGDVDPRVAEALAELDFSQEPGGWMKLALPLTMAPEEAAIEVETRGQRLPARRSARSSRR